MSNYYHIWEYRGYETDLKRKKKNGIFVQLNIISIKEYHSLIIFLKDNVLTEKLIKWIEISCIEKETCLKNRYNHSII